MGKPRRRATPTAAPAPPADEYASLTHRLSLQTQILEHLHESVITLDLDGYITSWNRAAEHLFGYSRNEAIGRHVLFLYAEEDATQLVERTLDPDPREIVVQRRRKTGELFWAGLHLSLLRDAHGRAEGLIGYLTDISERRRAEAMQGLHAQIVALAEEGILVADVDGRILSLNPALCRISGYRSEELVGRSLAMFRCAYHPPAFYEDIATAVRSRGRWQGELWSRRANGEICPLDVFIAPIRDVRGTITHYCLIARDITERKRSEGRIHQLAYYDPLSELPNRALFCQLLDQALAAARRSGGCGAVLFVNLNRFRTINDSLGHDVGNLVLLEAAARLRTVLRGADVVAHPGGDEFLLGLFAIARREDAACVAQKVLAALGAPILIDAHELSIGAAIGIAVYPEDGGDTETLVSLADVAMHRAKESGGDGHAFYDPAMNQSASERLALEAGLRRAIERGELQLHYQPKVSLASGAIVGAEALVRWQHPVRGMVSPGEFIPVAERTGLIGDISRWVLDRACAQARAWADAGMAPLRIAVNLSARDFSVDLPERVAHVLARHGVKSEWLELEITEGMLMNHSEAVISMMQAVNALGVTLALDDFGTGYSSLSYLKRFPIHTLKIDRSFVINIPTDGDDCAIAAAIVGMAARLGHQVIAEGVESPAQVTFLRDQGCNEIQGYLFSPPVRAEQFKAMVDAGKTLS